MMPIDNEVHAVHLIGGNCRHHAVGKHVVQFPQTAAKRQAARTEQPVEINRPIDRADNPPHGDRLHPDVVLATDPETVRDLRQREQRLATTEG
jgi:hypothetical protein